jgi:cellulose synthase/poly-beta-1,6-N-acetylglucosamine synthase-like glycosyltransferase
MAWVTELITGLVAALYTLSTLWLASYGLNGLLLAVLYWRHRRQPCPEPHVPTGQLPPVTIQLPLYNEKHVAECLIDAVAELEYPRSRLQVQVLDDSTDETARLAEARAAFHRERGLDIVVLHRDDRAGFKAGALAQAMPQARGDLVAIFDADFRPHPDFLLRTVPHLVADEGLGMVQARWSHLNAEYSLLTRAQALALDGHFAVEQAARSRSGLLMHFNGTAGVWRRACIEDSGGWASDTLCEDLDLSYRAQVRGWRFLYLADVDVPSELPPQMLAFRRQQARWAQGSVQCLRKLAPALLRAPCLSPVKKLMGLVHLSGYLAYPLMLLLLLLTPLLLLHPHAVPRPLQLLAPICLGPLLVYVTSQWALYADWRRRLLALPLLLVVGTGVAWSNTLAIWKGLTRWGGEMKRTPKFRLEGREGGWTGSTYRLTEARSAAGELVLALYALAAVVLAFTQGGRNSVPFLLLYAGAFGLVAGLGLREAWRPGGRSPSVRDLGSRKLEPRA